jgi:putative FmdB family regulatory protein
MPIYEFACLACGNEFERIQSFSDTSTPTCPNCQSVQVQRKLSSPAIHFKGSGWYVTDSKNSSKQSSTGKAGENTDSTADSSGGAEKSDSATKSDTKAESTTKAETKNESKPKTETKAESSKESSTPAKSSSA